MKNIFIFGIMFISLKLVKIFGVVDPPKKTHIFGGGSDTVNDDNFGYVSRRKQPKLIKFFGYEFFLNDSKLFT